jgi:DNA end-binding protein Ku
VALYTAASTAERIFLSHPEPEDQQPRAPRVCRCRNRQASRGEDQVKGYETGAGEYIAFEPEEIAKTVPAADKTLDIEALVPCGQVDDVYFDRPCFLAPSMSAGAEAFVLIRDGIAQANVAAVARTVLFRRVRSVLIRAHGGGLIAHTLNRLRGPPRRRGVRAAAGCAGR